MCGTRRRIALEALAELGQRALPVAAVPQRNTEVVVRLRRSRIECNRAFEMSDPRAQVSLLAEREPQQRVSAGVLLITLQRAAQELAGGVEVALRGSSLSPLVQIVGRARRRGRWLSRSRSALFQGRPERVVALAQLGIDFEGSLEGSRGAGKISSLPECLPELVVDTRIVAILRGDLPEMFECSREIAFLPQRHPQVEVRGDIVRFEGQRGLKDLCGFRELAALNQGGSEIRVGAPVLRIEGDRFAELRHRASDILLCRERHTQPVVRLGRLGRGLDGALKCFQRTHIVISIQVGDAENDEQAGIARMAFNGRLEFAQ